MNASEYTAKVLEWNHIFTRQNTIKNYINLTLLPIITDYNNYKNTIFITKFKNSIYVDIDNWYELLISDNPSWWAIDDFLENCYKTGIIIKKSNGENIETDIYNIINYIPSIQSLNSSDMLITINNR